MKTEESSVQTGNSTLLPAVNKAASNPVWAVVIIAVFSFIIFGYSLWYPLGRDQAIFAYIADRIGDGGMPYKDAWDFKSPGIYYIYRLSFMLFGRAEMSVRIVDMLTAFATSLFLWHIFYRRKQGSVGVAAGILYASLYGLSGYWCLAQTEGFAALFTTIAAHSLLSPHWNRASRLLIMGLALGAAFVLKFSFLLVALGLAAYVIWSSDRTAKIRTGILLLLSFTAVPALTAVYFASHGALGDALAASVTFASHYHTYPPKAASDVVLDFIISGFGRKTVYDILILPLVLLGIAYASSALRREQNTARVWMLSSIAAVAVQLKFFPYHWVTVFAPAALLGGLAISSVTEMKTSDGRVSRTMVLIIASLFIVRGLLAAVTEWGLWSAPTPPNSVSPWLAQFSTAPGQGVSYASDAAVAEYIKEHTSADDTVLVLGFEPLINFLSERKAPTRFFYMDAVTASWTPSDWRDEYVMDTAAAMPAVIVVTHNDTHIWRNKDSFTLLHEWPEMDQLIKEHYVQVARFEPFDIFQVKK